MSWALVSTAAAGLNAGAGLLCLLTDRSPSPDTEPDLQESFWKVNSSLAGSKVALSSMFGAAASAAALAAYVSGGDAADPGWISCAVISGIIPLYNTLIVGPTASVVQNEVMQAVSKHDKNMWLSSFRWKSTISTGFAVVAYVCTLLMMNEGSGGGGLGWGGGGGGDSRTANPFRFW